MKTAGNLKFYYIFSKKDNSLLFKTSSQSSAELFLRNQKKFFILYGKEMATKSVMFGENKLYKIEEKKE